MLDEAIEKEMVNRLIGHLKIAESWNYKVDKMIYIDGFLNALCMATGKKYRFNGTNVYIEKD